MERIKENQAEKTVSTKSTSVKLTNIEAQRIIALLDELIAKMEVFSLANRELHSGDVEFSQETQAQLISHVALEREYMQLLVESAQDQGESDGQIDQFASRISDSARETVRLLIRDNSAVKQLYSKVESSGFFDPKDPRRSTAKYLSVTAIEEDEGMALAELIRALCTLRDITFKRLLTTAEEEKSMWEFVQEVMVKETQATAQANALHQELAAEKKARERDLAQKHEAIDKLKDELSELRLLNSERIKASEKQSKERESSEGTHFATKEAVLKESVKKLTEELSETLREDREAEENLRKKKLRNEKRLEELIANYDQDMEEKHTELMDLRDIYAREKRLLAEFNEHYAMVATKNEEDENRLAKEKLNWEQRAKEWKKINDAAAKIQAMFRAFKVRKIFRERMKKRRKKKGRKPKK